MRLAEVLPVLAPLSLGLFVSAASLADSKDTPAKPLPKGPLNVAFVLTRGANVIDFAGPWEVFQDVMIPELGSSMDEQMPYHLFTVSDSKAPVEMTGGLRVAPAYTFTDAPTPDIVVVGAQAGSPQMLEWLKKASAQATIMSVCTGAFKLAKAGLLDGRKATTHHEFFDDLEKAFPNVKVQRGPRWVQSSERVYTAGGLTSGIDLALHLVAERYGEQAAERTASYMEHSSQEWRSPIKNPRTR